MIIPKEYIEELNKTDGHTFEFKFKKGLGGKDRRHETLEIMKKQSIENIVHVGCSGHMTNIDKQIAEKRWFHGMVSETFENVVGIDINNEAIEHLKSLQIERVYDKDLINDSEFIMKQLDKKMKNDKKIMIAMPEVLEHITDPVSFLKRVKDKYPAGTIFMISVPNTLGSWNILKSFKHNSEKINIEHKTSFTPVTLMKTVNDSGYRLKTIDFADMSYFTKIIKRPILSNTIILTAEI